jgi:catechol 2,3-dioxygenase-like lactoylglutathione lyase family enzyme
VDNVDACRRFYGDLLGFDISDTLNIGQLVGLSESDVGAENMLVYFMRHNTDHHSFALFPMKTIKAVSEDPDQHLDSVNQVTWQVGSLREVIAAEHYLAEVIAANRRRGRDMPGSNWHIYSFDPEGTVNELYYGIEQIGWNGHSKPLPMYDPRFIGEVPELPQAAEFEEVEDALAEGVDLTSGYRKEPTGEPRYDVGGVLLKRPFKAIKIGPVRLFTDDVDADLAYYRDRLGLMVTEEVEWRGYRCAFLRVNTEHHSLALYPSALQGELGLSPHTRCLSFGLQLAEYRQLRDAIGFLESSGVTVKYLPPELFPGVGYTAFAIDPDGHAIQLYDYMEQVGWDGRPRPADQRPAIDNDAWPQIIDFRPDGFMGEAYLGPWG